MADHIVKLKDEELARDGDVEVTVQPSEVDAALDEFEGAMRGPR